MYKAFDNDDEKIVTVLNGSLKYGIVFCENDFVKKLWVTVRRWLE